MKGLFWAAFAGWMIGVSGAYGRINDIVTFCMGVFLLGVVVTDRVLARKRENTGGEG